MLAVRQQDDFRRGEFSLNSLNVTLSNTTEMVLVRRSVRHSIGSDGFLDRVARTRSDVVVKFDGVLKGVHDRPLKVLRYAFPEAN